MIKAFCDMCEGEIKKNEKVIRVIGELRSEIMGEDSMPSPPGRSLNMGGVYFCSAKCTSEYMFRWVLQASSSKNSSRQSTQPEHDD